MSTQLSYSELITIPTFEERFEYLKLNGSVGSDTFGFDRYVNQEFYRSKEWKRVRDAVICRDLGCDLAVPGCELDSRIVVHHMNPIYVDDITGCSNYLLNPEFLITTSHATHNAIHYGDANYVSGRQLVERKPNDTCPWR